VAPAWGRSACIRVIHEEQDDGTVVKYYHALGRAIAMRTVPASGPDELHYLLSDHLGSTTKLLDDQGGVVSEVKYWPYGEMRSVNGTPATDKLYTGQQIEPSTTGLGLYNYGARFYSTTLGRFLSVDPIVPEMYNPQDWNGYTYVRNNPMRYTDPTGMRWHDGTGGGGGSTFVCLEFCQALRALAAANWLNGQMVNTCGPTCQALHAVARHRQNVIGALKYWQQVRRNQFLAEVRREHNQRMGEGMRAAAAIAEAEAAKQDGGRSLWGSVKGVVSGGAGALVDGVSACLDSTVCKTAAVTVGVAGCTAATGGAGTLGCAAAGTAVLAYNDAVDCVGGSTTGCVNVGVAAGLGLAGGGGGHAIRGVIRPREIPLGTGNNWRLAPFGNQYSRVPHYHRRSFDRNTGKTLPGGSMRYHRPWERGF
jgi:RHS repeat-associated protein